MKIVFIAAISAFVLISCAMPRALDHAVQTSNTSAVALALANGEDPNAVRGGFTPLIRAGFLDNAQVMAELLEYGADPYVLRQERASQYPPFVQYRFPRPHEVISTHLPAVEVQYDAFCAAAQSANPDVLKALLDKGFDPQRATPNPVLCALQGKAPAATLALLVDAGMALTALRSEALLQRAVVNEYAPAAAVEFLIDRGVNVNTTYHKAIRDHRESWQVGGGESALVVAVARAAATDSHYDVIRVLLENDSAFQNDALYVALVSGCETCAVQLLTAGAVTASAETHRKSNTQWGWYLTAIGNDMWQLAVDAGVDPLAGFPTSDRRDIIAALNQRRASLNRPALAVTTPDPARFRALQYQYSALLPGKRGQRVRDQQLAQAQQQATARAAHRKQDQVNMAEAGAVIQALLAQNAPLKASVDALADAERLCELSDSLASDVRDFKCSFMAKGRYREYGESAACLQAKPELADRVRTHVASACTDARRAETQLLSPLANDYQRRAMRQAIRTGHSGNWSRESVNALHGEPLAMLQQLRDADQQAAENQQHIDHQAAWAGVVAHAASNDTAGLQQRINQPLDQAVHMARQVVIDQAMIDAAVRAARGSAQTDVAVTQSDAGSAKADSSESGVAKSLACTPKAIPGTTQLEWADTRQCSAITQRKGEARLRMAYLRFQASDSTCDFHDSTPWTTDDEASRRCHAMGGDMDIIHSGKSHATKEYTRTYMCVCPAL